MKDAGFAAMPKAMASSSSIRCGASPTSFRVASDKTVTQRYDITRDDRLRSFVNAERISTNSYITIAGWAFQGLRVDDVQKQIPFALPAIDARVRLVDPVLGGKVEIEGNSLSIIRIEGQDTQRAFASARWDLRRLTPWGQELTLTGYLRGDVYHTDDSAATAVAIYRGTDGWHTRGSRRWPPTSNGHSSGRRSGESSASSQGSSWSSPRRHPTFRFPTKTRVRSTLRTATCSPSTASPATTGGRTDRA